MSPQEINLRTIQNLGSQREEVWGQQNLGTGCRDPLRVGVRTLRRWHCLTVEVGLGVLPKLEPAANCDLCVEASGRMKKALSPPPAFQHLSRVPW